MVVTRHGGHIGFLEGLFPFEDHYCHRLYEQYLSAIKNNLNFISELVK